MILYHTDELTREYNKSLQTDNLRGVDFAVSLSLNFTAKSTPHKLRLSEALCLKEARDATTNRVKEAFERSRY